MIVKKIGHRSVDITSLDKVLFPRSKITKGDLIDYYQNIAHYMVPYTKNRLISMVRYPEGIDHEGFYQKDAGSYFPSWIQTKRLKKETGGFTDYVIINNAATLVYLANQYCITPHLWLSKVDKINYPDKVIFDLDPSGHDFGQVKAAAFIVKSLMEDLGLSPFAMLTGSRGMHVVVPIRRDHTFDWVRGFAHRCAEVLVKNHPKMFTLEIRKEKRGKKIFLDILRNAYAQTAVAPYAVRPKEGAPVAAPIWWEHVKEASLKATTYTIKNIFEHLEKTSNPWQDFNRNRKSLAKAQIRIEHLL